MSAGPHDVRRGTGFRQATPLVLALAVMVGLLIVAPAHAAFPGANGRITFTRCDSSSCNDADIWTIGADGTGSLQLTSGTANYDEESVYSADGRRIVFERCDPAFAVGCAITIMNADGTSPAPITDGTHFDYYPAFSPSGTVVVFSRNDGSDRHLFTMQADGTGVAPLTSGTNVHDVHPMVSPDGSKVIFVRYIPGTSDSIWVVNAAGGTATPLTTQPVTEPDSAPDWSPDGTKIIFSRFDGTVHHYRTWIMDANGANAHMVLDPGASLDDDEPAYSPDGTRIAFERMDATNAQPIAVMNADGTGAATLTTASNNEYAAHWQPVAPIFLGAPAIAGTAVNGSPLTANAAAVTGGGAASFEWLRCDGAGNGCVPIPGATAGGYTLTTDDIGHGIRVRQSQANAAGSAAADSAPTTAVAPNPSRCANVFAGTSGLDTLRGTVGGDRISGLAGNDVLSGGAGADCINGGAGNDRISGGAADDVVTGGSGNDKITGGAGKDTASGGSGNDNISGGAGKDKLSGGAGKDKINAADGTRDRVNCGKGTDKVRADRKDKLSGCERVTIVGAKH